MVLLTTHVLTFSCVCACVCMCVCVGWCCFAVAASGPNRDPLAKYLFGDADIDNTCSSKTTWLQVRGCVCPCPRVC